MASILDSIFSSHTMKHGASSMEINRNERLKSSENTQVFIIGGGIACSALAYTLGKDGLRVHVIMETDRSEHDRTEENLLQAEECLKLIELGLEDCVAGRSFMTQIRKKASSLPNVRLEQGLVTSLVEEKGAIKGVHYKNKLGEELTANAPLTIVCNNFTLKRSPCATTGAVFVENVSNKQQPATGGEMQMPGVFLHPAQVAAKLFNGRGILKLSGSIAPCPIPVAADLTSSFLRSARDVVLDTCHLHFFSP